MIDRIPAESPGPGSSWSLGSIERARSGVAATTRMWPLFPEDLAELIEDEAWAGVARLVREQTATVVVAGDYPFAAFQAEEPVAVATVAADVLDAVLGLLPPRTDALDRCW